MSASRHCVLCVVALLSCYAAAADARELYDYEYYAQAPQPTTIGPKADTSPPRQPPADYYYSGDDYVGPDTKPPNARTSDAQTDLVAGTLPGAVPAQQTAVEYDSTADPEANQEIDSELDAYINENRDSQCRYAGHKQSKTPESARLPLNMPCIDGPRTTNVTAQLNSHVQLTCTVHASRPSLITWWLHSQTYPTAIGMQVFVRNERIAVKHEGQNWTLEIKFVQPEDAGVYKCQIDLPPLINKQIFLTVVDELPETQANSNLEISDTSTEPKVNDQEARGKGSGDSGGTQNQVVEVGNPVELQCVASGKKGVAPQSADWFFRSHKLTNLQNRIAVINTVKDNKLMSTLRILAARVTDEGSYICRSSEKQIYMFELRVIGAEQSPPNPVVNAMKNRAPTHTSNTASLRQSSTLLPIFLCLAQFARTFMCSQRQLSS